jgi:signal transduction histidine kinase
MAPHHFIRHHHFGYANPGLRDPNPGFAAASESGKQTSPGHPGSSSGASSRQSCPARGVQLGNRIAQDNDRLVFVDPQGTVLFDSRDTWTGQAIDILDNETGLGSFNSPDGQTLTYALVPVGPDDDLGYLAAVGGRAPVLPALIAELGWGFLLAGTVALLVSLLLGVLIARSMARPLQRISTATSAVAGGDYEHRVPEKGPPEVKRVAISFNVMADQVQASQQAMRDFVSNVSHELKTPLTSIQGFSQAIMEGATPDETARQRAAGIIHQEASRMSRLVEDLLDLARIDSGQVVMHKTQLDLAEILSTSVNRLLPQASKKKVSLAKNWGALPPIVGDGDRLAQVFTNLMSNAVKYTPAGGRVTVASRMAEGIPHPRRVRLGLVQPDATTMVSNRGDFVEVNISDTGPGIPPEDLARIFERFYQVDKSRKRGRGTGLGLAISKEIIEAHGGYLRAESIQGLGTKFMILLPVTEADAKTLVSSRRS